MQRRRPLSLFCIGMEYRGPVKDAFSGIEGIVIISAKDPLILVKISEFGPWLIHHAHFIFILILQQFDGNVLGPRILSGTVGISSFWVMFSIIVFGGLFGFLGMLIGVPLGALILSLIAALCRISLQHKSLPVDSGAYTSVKSFDPESGEPVPLPPKPGLRDKPGGVISGILKRFRKKK